MDSKIVEFDEVIAFHTAWKRKLKNYLTKPDGSLKPADVANADGCALAEWIRVNEHHYSSMPEFATLKGGHIRLHELGADLVERVEREPNVAAEMEPGATSDFSAISSAIVMAVMAMKRRMGSKG